MMGLQDLGHQRGPMVLSKVRIYRLAMPYIANFRDIP